MRDMGLDLGGKYAADVAVIMHGGGLWAPCLWLNTETNSNEYSACWHVTRKLGKVSVPHYFNNGTTLAKLQHLTSLEIVKRISRYGMTGDIAIFRDHESKKTIYGPRQLYRH